eukprot:gb/GECG01013404.1/.p1 GENE.gb/GECG01013404.1/~~gb/GECG01013404.1/.p1  ORF type:complete len:247 (+),score=59.68 gb/GECG01013404.1/:1-741(+)
MSEAKKNALQSFLKKKGKKSSSKKKSDDDSNKQKENTAGWNIPEESAPSGAPKIQVKDLQSSDKEEDVKTRIEKEEFRARIQEVQKRSKQTAKKNENTESQAETTPEPSKLTWMGARRSAMGARKPNLNSVAQFPSLKGNRGPGQEGEREDDGTQQKATVWGAPVEADTMDEEEEQEPPKKAIGEDVDLVPPLESQELSKNEIKERAKGIIEVRHSVSHCSLPVPLCVEHPSCCLHCNIGHLLLQW